MSKAPKLRFDLRTAGLIDEAVPASIVAQTICPLCDRPVPPTGRSSRHHLTPKLKGGARLETVRLHQICHSAIHARFSEAELARRLYAVDLLKHEPAMVDFLTWVKGKPDDFHAPTATTRDRRVARKAAKRR